MDIEKLIEQLSARGVGNGTSLGYHSGLFDEAATAISTLQGENEKLRETVDKYATAARVIALHLKPFCDESLPYDEMIADAARKASDELDQVKRERDAAIEATRNMAEYIVCIGRVDEWLCDEIDDKHHLKFQPKNDGNYDNEPCYECVKEWFLQGHKWREGND